MKLATVVEGDPKAPFTIAATGVGGATPLYGFLHFTLDTHLFCAKC